MESGAEASRAEAGRGALAAVGCYLLWGFCPLFWALLDNVGSIEIIGQRIVWSLALTVVVCKFILKVDFVGLLRDARARRFLIPSGLLIMLNWSLYIVAMVTNNVVEASLGYYINPLVSIVLGLVVFRERLTPLQIAATVLSAAGVIYFTVNYGQFSLDSPGSRLYVRYLRSSEEARRVPGSPHHCGRGNRCVAFCDRGSYCGCCGWSKRVFLARYVA